MDLKLVFYYICFHSKLKIEKPKNHEGTNMEEIKKEEIVVL